MWDMASPKTVDSRLNLKTLRRPRRGTTNFIENLPPEILFKILSYLDVAALYTLSHVSSRFFKLASDNSMWHKIFVEEFCNKGRKTKYVWTTLRQTAGVEDLGVGHWKRLYFKAGVQNDMLKWRKKLCNIDCHTGLPRKTELVLNELAVTWQLIVVEPSEQQKTLDQVWVKFSESSVMVCWTGIFPDFQQISALQLVGIRRIAFHRTGLEQPAKRSLMVNIDMAAVSKSTQDIGQDKLVELKLLQSGVVVGLWKYQRSVAFVMFTLHKKQLLERWTRGSSVCPVAEPAAKNIPFYMDSDYRLNGYQLHITLHNSERSIMSRKFSDLFFCECPIQDGQLNMDVINHRSTKYWEGQSGSASFPWTVDFLHGDMQDCCFMSLTLWQDLGNPKWCVSSAVCLKPCQSAQVDYEFAGQHFTIHFRDEVGQVNFHLVHDAERDSYVVTGLAISITTAEINSHSET